MKWSDKALKGSRNDMKMLHKNILETLRKCTYSNVHITFKQESMFSHTANLALIADHCKMFLHVTFCCPFAHGGFDSVMDTTIDTMRENVRKLGNRSKGMVSKFLQLLSSYCCWYTYITCIYTYKYIHIHTYIYMYSTCVYTYM